MLINENMNIRDFKYIIAIDKCKSFAKAAKECFVSQAALSMQIQKIEDVLGIQIFERDKKTVVTTCKGLEVVKYAYSILEIYNSIKSIKQKKQNIRIGLIYTVSNYLLLKIIPLLSDFEDNINFSFFEDKTNNLITNLQKGNLDGIIVASNTSCKTDINQYKTLKEYALFKENLVLVLSQNHEFQSSKQKISTQDFKSILIQNELILLEDGHCLKDHIQEIAEMYKIKNQVKTNLFTSNVEMVIKMILNNNGISILPKSSISKIKGIKYFEMPKNEARLVSLYYRKNTSKFDYMKHLINTIHNVI